MTAVLFDLDGTLTDSGPGITACIQHALRTLGKAVPEAELLRWCIGPPLSGSFAKLLATEDGALVAQAVWTNWSVTVRPCGARPLKRRTATTALSLR